jgi:hypothetical protein
MSMADVTHRPMPTYSAACRAFVEGEPGALWEVGLGVLSRAAFIGLGMYAFGERENLVRNAIAGSIGVEVFVIGYVLTETGRIEYKPKLL